MSANKERWQVLEDLFQRASDMDAAGRDTFLREACGGNAELRGELDALLAYAGNTVDWLQGPVDNAARELALTGRRVGSYALLRLLGEGGMGRVFLAARADEQYQQLVAIKLMHADLRPRQTITERFVTERQILANLNHPNIARLLDGGMTPEGTPYLVMEYIDGVPLDEYCRANNASLDQKLKLFLGICSAVEYAHTNLVVHRDIKPGNVLVGQDGAPKLLDFGIAKLLDGNGSAPANTTARIMTPEFASPEQVRGESVTAATDVYGLGLLLYDLLSGTHPFADHRGNPIEMMRQICEAEPKPPSAAVLDGGGRQEIQGDLDRIVLMALQKDPERRYASVTALARDVFAYMSGYPVFANRGGCGYRAGKFVRRHRLMVAGIALFVLSLAGFGAGMAVLKQRAYRERLKEERAATFLAEMFRAATPQEARGRTVTARELLDRGSERLDKELNGDPEVRASLLYNIGDAYLRLGLYDRAKELAERSYKLRKQVLGPRHLSTAESLLLFADATRRNGGTLQSEPLFREALDIQRTKLEADSAKVAETLSSLGECLYLEGKTDEAEASLRQALFTFRKHDPNLGSAARDYLARLLETKGEYIEAAQLLREAVEIDRRTLGIDDPRYTASLHNYAGALSRLGDQYTAESILRESLATERRVLGATHPDLGYPLNLMGVVALDQGDWRKSEPFLRESFTIWSHVSNRALVVSALTNWGRLLDERGNYAEARRYFERAVELAGLQPDQPVSVAWVSSRYAVSEFDAGRYAVAEVLARRAVDLQSKVSGGENAPSTALALITLAESRVFQGDPASAEPILRSAVYILKGKLPGNYPPVITAEVRLGECLTAEGKAAAAEPVLREALSAAYTPPFKIPSWQVGEAESALAWCLDELGHSQEARELARRSKPRLVDDPRPIFRKPAATRISLKESFPKHRHSS
jgi:serine/threonine-protein kinase